MSIEVFWDELNILTIEKKDNLYFSYVDTENLVQARKSGFPIFFLKQISVVSDELPAIVRHRIPSFESINNKINLKEKTMETIIDYINETKCKRPTDKFSIKIEIN